MTSILYKILSKFRKLQKNELEFLNGGIYCEVISIVIQILIAACFNVLYNEKNNVKSGFI